MAAPSRAEALVIEEKSLKFVMPLAFSDPTHATEMAVTAEECGWDAIGVSDHVVHCQNAIEMLDPALELCKECHQNPGITHREVNFGIDVEGHGQVGSSRGYFQTHPPTIGHAHVGVLEDAIEEPDFGALETYFEVVPIAPREAGRHVQIDLELEIFEGARQIMALEIEGSLGLLLAAPGLDGSDDVVPIEPVEAAGDHDRTPLQGLG